MPSTSAFDIGLAAQRKSGGADGVDPAAAAEPDARDPKIFDAMLPKMLMISLLTMRCRRSDPRSPASSIGAMSIPSFKRAYKAGKPDRQLATAKEREPLFTYRTTEETRDIRRQLTSVCWD